MAFTIKENCRFWVFTIAIVILWQLVWAQSVYADDSNNDAQLNVGQQTNICNALCGHCDCMGFFCGEECICECNQNQLPNHNKTMLNQTDTECLGVMQHNARALNLPFQLLIQGPDANRIVRTALNFEQPEQLDATADNMLRDKRATVVIYRPTSSNNNKAIEENMQDLQRQRRGVVEHLEWFTDLTNGLVRPAPMRGSRKAQPTEEQQPKKRASKEQKERFLYDAESEYDEFEQPEVRRSSKSLIKPASLYKRQRNNNNNNSEMSRKKSRQNSNRLSENMDYDADTMEESLAQTLVETPLKMVGKFPQALKDAMRRIRTNAAARKKEIQQQRRALDNEAAHLALEEELEDDENEKENENESKNKSKDQAVEQENFDEMFADLRKHLLGVIGVMPTNKPEVVKIPMRTPSYRAGRFLQRIQDSIAS